MSERMTPIPFEKLLRALDAEYEKRGSIFGVSRLYRADEKKTLPLFGEAPELPFGPAAGPHTQLAQNIAAAYAAGARFFELKTVQTMDGEELARCVPRPCILAADEGYNCEWSTELTVEQALNEYIKAWFLLTYMARRYGLGSERGFVFNMSVGYDLAGISSAKIDRFIESLKDASATAQYRECSDVLGRLGREYSAPVEPHICRGATLSTLHGCPPDEIERIAAYLITEKRLNTFVKCNPTLLGYASARTVLDSMGYGYIVFDEHHFNEDLQYADAVPMFRRLSALAAANGLEFGLKLSNTFPVDVTRGELPSTEMYMSGRSLYPLTMEMAKRLSAEFGGKLRISFSGGADAFNIAAIFSAGIWPITVATTLLKPGGYQRMKQLAQELTACEFAPFAGVDTAKAGALAAAALTDTHHVKPVKPKPRRRFAEEAPLTGCYAAPCKNGCPIGQDIPEYISLVEQQRWLDALRLITERNPLPFITGTICAHRCAEGCTRVFMDEAVEIRAAKLAAAEHAYDELMAAPFVKDGESDADVAIIGAGPAGLAAAYFLTRGGAKVTVFDTAARPGGTVRRVIPEFRISDEAIDKDAALCCAYGARLRLGEAAPADLTGYTHVILAAGASAPADAHIKGSVIDANEFLSRIRNGESVPTGAAVAVIGGGNTAMDAARAAKRLPGVETVSIVYRRTAEFMPADADELGLALAEDVEFLPLLAPVKQENGALVCDEMALGEPDASGRRRPVATGAQRTVAADLVVAATGAGRDAALLAAHGFTPDAGGKYPARAGNTFLIGDALRGPATVAEAVRDAADAAEAILGRAHEYAIPTGALPFHNDAAARTGILKMSGCGDYRCLACSVACENCVDVCPNRANTVIRVDDAFEVLHIDRACNECGNCATFCPYSSRPYRTKLTLFDTERDFLDSENPGFMVLDKARVRVRLDGKTADMTPAEIPGQAGALIRAVLDDYEYLL